MKHLKGSKRQVGGKDILLREMCEQRQECERLSEWTSLDRMGFRWEVARRMEEQLKPITEGFKMFEKWQ